MAVVVVSKCYDQNCSKQDPVADRVRISVLLYVKAVENESVKEKKLDKEVDLEEGLEIALGIILPDLLNVSSNLPKYILKKSLVKWLDTPKNGH